MGDVVGRIGLFISPKVRLSVVFALLLVTALLIRTPQKAAAISEINYSGTNTGLVGDDVVAGPFPIGFNFRYYGNTYTQGHTSLNGNFSFVSGTRRGFTNTSLSDPEYVDPHFDPDFPFDYADYTGPWLNTIYPFWDDLITQGARAGASNPTVYYTTIGTTPHRQFVMQWTNMYFFDQPEIPMGTFQMILDEGTNVIHFQYRDLLGGSASLGDSATVGIKGGDDTQFNEVSFNTASLSQGQAITFTPDGDTSYTVNTSASYLPIYVLPPGVPASPTVINPADGLTGAISTPTFEWGSVDLATSYSLLVSSNPDFSSTIANVTDLTDTIYTLGAPLAYSTTYYWKVAAVNDAGSSYSVTRSFTTAAQSFPVPAISDLSGGVLLTGGRANASALHDTPIKAKLTDSDHSQLVRYRIQIATDADFSDVTLDYRSTYGTEGDTRTFNVGSMSGGTYISGSNATVFVDNHAYYVRLTAEDEHAQSSGWSGPSTAAFTYDITGPSTPEAPALRGTASKAATTLAWAVVSDNYPASPFYKLEYSSSASFTTLSTATTNDVSTTLTGLNPGTYYARLRVTDSAGNISEPSPALTFEVPSPSATTSSVPANRSVATTNNVDAPQQTTPAATASLVIHIVDANNHPIKGALVTLHSLIQTAYTDEQGNATFTNVEAGTHHVIAEYNNLSAQGDVQVLSVVDGVEPGVANLSLQLKHLAAGVAKSGNHQSSPSNARYWVVGSAVVAGLLVMLLVVRRSKIRPSPHA